MPEDTPWIVVFKYFSWPARSMSDTNLSASAAISSSDLSLFLVALEEGGDVIGFPLALKPNKWELIVEVRPVSILCLYFATRLRDWPRPLSNIPVVRVPISVLYFDSTSLIDTNTGSRDIIEWVYHSFHMNKKGMREKFLPFTRINATDHCHTRVIYRYFLGKVCLVGQGIRCGV